MYTTKKAEQTKKLAAKLAKEVLETGPHQKHARVIGLVGDLGAGKTTFTQGFAKALGIKKRMISPTFLIMRKYQIPKSKFQNFYHMDAYRIHDPKELGVLDFKKILSDNRNILLIEWADQIKKVLPKDTVWIRFEHGQHEKERKIHF